jgi:hypothetical protein
MTETAEYIVRSYPVSVAKLKAKTGVLTEFDNQMLNAISKMKEKYKEHTNRRCSVLLSEKELRNIHNKVDVSPEEPHKMYEHEKILTGTILICTATKMNGEICTSKAKPGCLFCGRHISK